MKTAAAILVWFRAMYAMFLAKAAVKFMAAMANLCVPCANLFAAASSL